MGVHALQAMAPPCASHFSELALLGRRRLHSTLVAAQALFANNIVTFSKTNSFDILFPVLSKCINTAVTAY